MEFRLKNFIRCLLGCILMMTPHLLQIAYAQPTGQPEAPIQWINTLPVIDGVLDNELSYLEQRKFNCFWRFENPATDTMKVSYCLGYTSTHLYVYIETATDSITYRDRGFINGDGFKLLIAMPQSDSGTNEYYDLVFSPSKDKQYWARKRIWEYNREQEHKKKLSSATMFEEQAGKARCGFEALIAWRDILPYHPWFLEAMGYNLYFAKGLGPGITNGYAVVADEGIWDEEVPLRQYAAMRFETPASVKTPMLCAQPLERNLKSGLPILIRTVTIGATDPKSELRLVLRKDTATVVHKKDILLPGSSTLQYRTDTMQIGGILPGIYTLEISSGQSTANYTITVLPVIAFDTIQQNIHINVHKLSEGITNTLLFKLQLLRQKLAALKRYETGEEVLQYWFTFQQEYHAFQSGSDPYTNRTVPYQRAFRSKYDNTYQPYSLKLPKDYDPRKKYPLLVFLHGSGQDEQGVLGQARSDGNFIEIAPFARDRYRCYSSDSSQNDILEAIDDVCQYFPVDKHKIVIGGFSMGGYGALRTYFEHPHLYKGIAVFAGHPALASEWLGEGHPDFLNDNYLSAFSGVPIFIYHGRKDGALPVEKAVLLARKLKSKGSIVTERIVDNKAHEYPDDETNRIYFNWLKKLEK